MQCSIYVVFRHTGQAGYIEVRTDNTQRYYLVVSVYCSIIFKNNVDSSPTCQLGHRIQLEEVYLRLVPGVRPIQLAGGVVREVQHFCPQQNHHGLEAGAEGGRLQGAGHARIHSGPGSIIIVLLCSCCYWRRAVSAVVVILVVIVL